VSLPLDVTLLVLGAALMHASWNAIVKSSPDKLLDTTLLAAGGGLMCLAALPFLPPPEPASWPWLAASVVLHFLYFIALIGAYQWGDLSHTYPLMRGVAPLLVALAGVVVLQETLTLPIWTGIALISVGIVGPMLAQHDLQHTPTRATLIALANAFLIASYTLVDGAGTRLSGDPVSYCVWLFMLDAIPITSLALVLRGRELLGYARSRWHWGLLGSALTIVSYGIVLWALTRAPVAAVAALRETSVVIATVIGTVLFKEKFGGWRIPGAVLVVGGITALRL